MLGGDRLDRVNQLVRNELAAILERELEVPPGTLVTVTRVVVSPDTEHARVFVSVLPYERRSEVESMLVSRIGEFQRLLNRKLVMEYVPRIRFLLDSSEQQASRIDDLLDSLEPDR